MVFNFGIEVRITILTVVYDRIAEYVEYHHLFTIVLNYVSFNNNGCHLP
jgi:hypothetical protein